MEFDIANILTAVGVVIAIAISVANWRSSSASEFTKSIQGLVSTTETLRERITKLENSVKERDLEIEILKETVEDEQEKRRIVEAQFSKYKEAREAESKLYQEQIATLECEVENLKSKNGV